MGEEKRPKPMALGDAVARGIIANQTLAYFIGRTWLLFGKLGVDLKRMRFRQHLQHEVGARRPRIGHVPRRTWLVKGRTLDRAAARTRGMSPSHPHSLLSSRPSVAGPQTAIPIPGPQMAHYAEDCWDAEVETTYGWVECAGLADRSAYDLRAHTAMSKTELNAYEKFSEPREVEVTT
jgi:glycyl-tRNA synthetase (class II)